MNGNGGELSSFLQKLGEDTQLQQAYQRDPEGTMRQAGLSDETIQTVAGGAADSQGGVGDGGPAVNALLRLPFAVVVASDGTILIADTGNYRIRIVSSDASISSIAGTGQWGFSGDGQPAPQAEFDVPEGMALTSAGDLLVADTENLRVRKIPHLLNHA